MISGAGLELTTPVVTMESRQPSISILERICARAGQLHLCGISSSTISRVILAELYMKRGIYSKKPIRIIYDYGRVKQNSILLIYIFQADSDGVLIQF